MFTCTFHTNAPSETFSGLIGGRTFSFFFVDLKIPERNNNIVTTVCMDSDFTLQIIIEVPIVFTHFINFVLL